MIIPTLQNLAGHHTIPYLLDYKNSLRQAAVNDTVEYRSGRVREDMPRKVIDSRLPQA